MAEERKQEEQPLDQETLDQMISQASEGDNADQLESLLSDMDEPEPEADTAENADMDALADNMETMLDRLEGDETDETDDLLYQATLEDTEGTGSAELVDEAAEVGETTETE